MDPTCATLLANPYQPRAPEQTLLYQVLAEHFETFLEKAVSERRRLRQFVIREVRAFLRCGIRAYGFTRVRCPDCRHEFALPFSCTGCGFCDRGGLERLCRYLARPVSDDLRERLDDEHIGLQLKTPYSDGTEMIALSHDELIERLCELVPRPRHHRVHYHGVLASAARHRRLVVPNPPPSAGSAGAPPAAAVAAPDPLVGAPLATRRRTIRRLLWAELLRRTFDTDPLLCPQCGGMKMIASLHQAEVVCAILESHCLPTEAPFVRPSRGPPESDLWEVWW